MKCILWIVLGALLAGCASTTSVKVDSYSDVVAIPQGFIEGSSFAILPLDHANPLFAQEAAQKIKYSLKRLGYFIADRDSADYHLSFDVSSKSISKTVMTQEKIEQPPELKTEWVKDKNGKWQEEKSFKTSYKLVDKPVVRTYHVQECSIQVFRKGDSLPVWNGTTSCYIDNRDDLRERLDYLLTPLVNYFGASTQKQITLNLKEEDLF